MKKTNFTKLMTLCLMFLGLGMSQNVQAQCPNGQTNVNVAMSSETFDGENGWILYDATAGAVLAGVNSNPANGFPCANTTPNGMWTDGQSVNACVTNGNTIELYTYESFGDGWQNGNLDVTTNETAANYTNGCQANQGAVLYSGGSTATDNDLTDGTGDGGINCGAPLQTNPNGIIVVSSSFTVACLMCEITCPGDITSPTAPGTCDGGFVNIPLPTITADCLGTPACPNTIAEQVFPLNHGAGGTGNLQLTNFTIAGAPAFAAAEVTLFGAWNGDNSFFTENPLLSLEGTAIGNLPFGGPDCQENVIAFTVPAAVYNAAAGDGNLDFTIAANNAVNGFCANFPNSEYISLGVTVPECTLPYTNDYNGGQDASDIYPKGTTVVTYTTQDAFGNDFTCSFNVNVIDAEAPVLDCPGSETIGLDGGECKQAYYYDVTATDNCPAVDIVITQQSACDPFNDPINNSVECTVGQTSYFVLMPVAQAPFNITSLDVLTWSGGDVTVNIYDGTGQTNANNFATIPLLCTADGTLPNMGVGTVNFAGCTVPAGVDQLLVEVRELTAGPNFTLSVSNCGGGGTTTWIGCAAINPPVTLASVGFANDIAVQLNGGIPQEIEVIPNPNAPNGYNQYTSGDLLPIGEHCFEYRATDAAGNESFCTWCVTITEFPGPYANLSCNANINVSVDENCEAIICADQVLEGSAHQCYENYNVTVSGLSPASAIVGNGTPCVTIKASQLDGWNGMSGTFTVSVSDPNDANNSCWNDGWMIEDKFAPTIECPDPITIPCTASTAPGTDEVGASDAALEGPDAVGISWGDGTTGPVGSATLNVAASAGAKVDDLTVHVDLDHSWMGDVTVSLTSPAGTTVNMIAAQCGINDNMSADFAISGGAAPCDPVASPAGHENCNDPAYYLVDGATVNGTIAVGAFADFIGEDAGGDWTISFIDGVGGDGGCVQNLSMNVDWTVFAVQGPTYGDNCGQTTLVTEDVVTDFPCGSPYASIIERTHTVTDQKNNSASCTQIINVEFAKIADLVLPRNYDNLDLPALDCANADTSVGNLGSPTGGCGNINFTHNDTQIDICEGSYKILRHWVILDWCTGEIVNHFQTIKVLDTTGPTLTCPANKNVSTSNSACEATVLISGSEIGLSDDCSTGTLTGASISSGSIAANGPNWIATGLAIGTHTVTLTAEDACGNGSSCTFTITVTDQTPPVSICETLHTVSLTFDQPTIIPAGIFDDGSYDNCGPITMDVRRMTSCINFDWTTAGAGNDDLPNGIVNNADKGIGNPNSQTTGWYPAVPVDCCDVGNDFLVAFRVTDSAGNRNTCMVTVEVQDKIDGVINCPANADYECSIDILSISDIALAGVSATNNGGLPTYYSDGTSGYSFVGYYADAYDNCAANVFILDRGGINSCGESYLTNPNFPGDARRYHAIYPATTAVSDVPTVFNQLISGADDFCTQLLGVQNPNDFGLNDITWPQDVLVACINDNPAANIPTVNEDACSNVAITQEPDLYVPLSNDTVCYKIIRTWIVIDWCQYDGNGAGYWEHEQVIKVNDQTAPTIDSGCAYEEFDITTDNDGNFNNGCRGPVSITATGSDNCATTLNWSYQVWNSAGNLIATGSTSTYSQTLDLGEYTIEFTLNDGCGNYVQCLKPFAVVDNTPPLVYADYGLEINLSGGNATIWANDFDEGSSDECSGICDMRIASPSQGPGQTAPATGTSVSFDCNDIGNNTVDFWVKDCSNNWAYVSTFVIIQDNSGDCTTPSSSNITGGINTEVGEAVEGVTVDLTGNAPGMNSAYVTTDNGEFSFMNLPNTYNFTTTPSEDLPVLNGVSTYDLVLISKHILSIESLDSPYKMIAADINKSGSITTFDMVELRKLILFINTDFPNNTSWRFVEAGYVFPEPTNPWTAIFPEVASVNGLSADEVADFVGVKIGDVNGSAIPNNLVGGDDRTTVGDLVFSVDDQEMTAGQEYTVEFTAKDFTNVMGYQFSLAFSDAVEVVEVNAGDLAGMSAANFGMSKINEGVITTSWNASQAAKLNNNDVVFSVTFKANTAAQLSDVLNISSRYTVAEAYNGELELMNVAIEYNQDGEVAATSFDLYQNQPNPFKDVTVISFTLPEAATATLKVFDVSGRVLKSVEADYTKGYNEVTINRSDLSGSGVLYYQLETPTDSATKKMIIVD